ncbi:helix-turn-helix domain-containing protein [Streptomyces sp. WAC05374]|uniref:helix-turn-helix domain-containing protein n=1 Tax=Streptomyces sp. WAC05374 TaxID=2487420 RepID=UPI000F868E21|nr:pyridoxamine 5'-phosphate oxidase family protein [Streptomyces sp. WAC05374]RST17650.1 helix-turn-helix domain-containing protein [Streptomyces sp. WAC05374]TDF54775.1 helix-turn-helix domain-containing protein [Streptomyces sp. WAC05374]TDF56411.1 helix-turn-helix domain-containing protein [Streptomyces sp. WAC05374]
MSDRPQTGAAPSWPRAGAGDLGRRVAARREQLGMSYEDLARRTGAAPEYIRYLETHPATHGIGFLLRLADALGTSVDELTGGNVDLPPGIGQAAYHPELVELGEPECRQLLGGNGVGRVGVTTAAGPAILPVNYLVLDGNIAYRTSPNAVPAAAAGHEVAFEVDRIDDAFSRGWSVLVVGEARTVTEPHAVERLEAHSRTTPWAGGPRDLWITVTPGRVTGRRIVVRDR